MLTKANGVSLQNKWVVKKKTATLNKAGAAANNYWAVNNKYYNYCNNCIKTQGAQYHWLN